MVPDQRAQLRSNPGDEAPARAPLLGGLADRLRAPQELNNTAHVAQQCTWQQDNCACMGEQGG